MSGILIHQNTKKENNRYINMRIVLDRSKSSFGRANQEHHNPILQDMNVLNVVLIQRNK